MLRDGICEGDCLFKVSYSLKHNNEKESSKEFISWTFPKAFKNFKHEHSICTISTASSLPPVSPVLPRPEIHILFFNNCFWSWGENIWEFKVSSLKKWLSIPQQPLTVHSSSFLELGSIWSNLRSQRSRKGLFEEVGRRTLESRAAEHRGCEGEMGNVGGGMSLGEEKKGGPSRRRAS